MFHAAPDWFASKNRSVFLAWLLVALMPVIGVISGSTPILAMLLGIATLGVTVFTLFRYLPVIAVLFAGFVDLPRNVGNDELTGLGLVTIVVACLTWLLIIFSEGLDRRIVRVCAPLLMFTIWSFAISLATGSLGSAAIQNLLVLSSFPGLILLSSYYAQRNPDYIVALVRTLKIAILLAAVLYLGQEYVTDLRYLRMADRGFALFMLIGVAWFVAGWRQVKQREGVLAVASTFIILLSLSRTALVVAALLLPIAKLHLRSIRGWIQFFIAAAAIVLAGTLVFQHVDVIRDRFYQGDVAFQVSGVKINVSGRSDIWDMVLESYWTSPWIGQGAGSASQYLVTHAANPNFNHPHNDYLRILHDYGALGMLLWGLGFVNLIWRLINAGNNGQSSPLNAQFRWAALLSSIAVGLSMITDNVVIYSFVMAPCSVLIGAALGMSFQPEDESIVGEELTRYQLENRKRQVAFLER